jgi:hypothetical protein
VRCLPLADRHPAPGGGGGGSKAHFVGVRGPSSSSSSSCVEEEQQRQRQQAAALEDARRAAEARFFELLQDFVAVRAAPGAWLLPTGQHSVPSGPPFLRPARDRSGLRCVAVPPPPPPPPPPGAG